ncbi:DUF1996 domain-containing protein [Shewanella sp.]|uniref:DUF1996 domain-containing protein n=1 Tax=Shewanella sp. TaxID=50422 RepID=UPI0035645C02
MRPCQYVMLLLMAVVSGCGGSDSVAKPEQPTVVTKPAMPVFSLKPGEIIYEPYSRVAFSADFAASYECQLDSGDERGDIQECVSPQLLLPLTAGEHRLKVWALAENGDRSDPAELSWQVASVFGADGNAHFDLIKTTVMPSKADPASWRGIFRINCDFAHSSYNDPIVYPGKTNAAHLHRFYGNTLVDESTDINSLFTEGESSCQGNTLNRSAYWVPALLAPEYNPATGEALYDEQGDLRWRVVPAVVGNDDEAHEIFYYSAGVDDVDAIQSIPVGMKIIAGNAKAGPGQQQDTGIVRWHCQSWESSDADNPRWSSAIPECAAPDRLRMDVFFPSCWNGTDLDSADHQSHLAYPHRGSGTQGMICPATHPVPIIRVSFHYAFGVTPDVYEPQSKSSRGWRLASDMYEVTQDSHGGMSLHADWMNGWHPEVLQTVLDVCIREGLDCHDGNLANGFRLTGTRPGSQTEPPVINMGMGYQR